MRYFVGIFLSLMTLSAHAQIRSVCGQYQMEDFGGRVAHSMIDFTSFRGRQIHYSIQNAGSFDMTQFVRGLCYCVQGDIRMDPEFEGDRGFRQVWVESIYYGPYSGCL